MKNKVLSIEKKKSLNNVDVTEFFFLLTYISNPKNLSILKLCLIRNEIEMGK